MTLVVYIITLKAPLASQPIYTLLFSKAFLFSLFMGEGLNQNSHLNILISCYEVIKPFAIFCSFLLAVFFCQKVGCILDLFYSKSFATNRQYFLTHQSLTFVHKKFTHYVCNNYRVSNNFAFTVYFLFLFQGRL